MGADPAMRATLPIEAAADRQYGLAAEHVPIAVAVAPVEAVIPVAAVTQAAIVVVVTAVVDIAAADTDNG